MDIFPEEVGQLNLKMLIREIMSINQNNKVHRKKLDEESFQLHIFMTNIMNKIKGWWMNV